MKSLASTVDALDRRGIKIIFCVVPTKISMLPENTAGGVGYPRDYRTRYTLILTSLASHKPQAVDFKRKLLSVKNTGCSTAVDDAR